MTVEELPGYLRRIADGVARKRAPEHIVTSMGLAYQIEVVKSMHGASPSPPGTPPARVTGTLARSVRTEPARQIREYAAETSVAPHTVYARIQQKGGHIYPRHMLRKGPREAGSAYSPAGLGELGFLRWENKSGVHFARHVYLPPRPYMVMTPGHRRAVHEAAVKAANRFLP